MFNKTKKLLQQHSAKLQRLDAELQLKNEELSFITESISIMNDKFSALSDRVNRLDELLSGAKDSDPIEKHLANAAGDMWGGFTVTEVDKESGRVGIKLDWNDEFQKFLKRSGIPGNTDEERMSIWITSLIKEWGDEIDSDTAKKYRDDL